MSVRTYVRMQARSQGGGQVGQCPMSKGGGGACECPRGGCFSIFRRADDVTRTISKGGGGCL